MVLNVIVGNSSFLANNLSLISDDNISLVEIESGISLSTALIVYSNVPFGKRVYETS